MDAELRHAFGEGEGDPSLLTEAEQVRAASFSERRRSQFVLGRTLLRRLAGEVLCLPPCDVPLEVSSEGRPELFGTGLFASVSHSGAGALAVVSRVPVGCDLEDLGGRSRDEVSLSRRYFHVAEAARIEALAVGKRRSLFLEQWTRKEALFKSGLLPWPDCLAADLWDGICQISGGLVRIASLPGLPAGWVARAVLAHPVVPVRGPQRLAPFRLAQAAIALSAASQIFPTARPWGLSGASLGLLAVGLGVASKRSFFGPVHTRLSDSRCIALTFDDGPDPSLTPDVLDLLSRYDIHATFFVVARQAEKHPELVQRLLAQGHQLGCHDLHHSPYSNFRMDAAFVRELGEAREILRKIAGRVPYLYRPPVGLTNPHLFVALRRYGMACVCWNRSAVEAGNRRLDHIRRIGGLAEGGAIVLMHDVLPHPEYKAVFLEQLDALCCEISRRGLVPGRLDELLGLPTWSA